ncbi:magnetosome protein MamQ-II [Candidatus Magnetoovum chiemensis]|nr:magnetosome protein MamQ-II [Candidatus Magnetoovum chiemensis]
MKEAKIINTRKRYTSLAGYTIAFIVLDLVLVYEIENLVHNKFIDDMHFLDIAHDDLEAEIQRRYDLFKINTEAANQYLNIERQIFDELIKLNDIIESTLPLRTTKEEKENQIITLLNELTALAEAYPDLKSKGPYLYLIQTMKYSNDRVTQKRMKYVEKLYEYNLLCSVFPYSFFSRVYGYSNIPFYEAELEAKKEIELASFLKNDKYDMDKVKK